ncbi:uncharacterized protein LOC143886479 isoform X2 [Tasmannia lanceolata]|uniref:uncharacterized protein LOC143886479 isoform X2 n=1 Tax=Tasmannia lanceolata TaxID=3420 RepID=UPI0040644F04
MISILISALFFSLEAKQSRRRKMDFLQELVLIALISILLSLLLAKLVSMASSTDFDTVSPDKIALASDLVEKSVLGEKSVTRSVKQSFGDVENSGFVKEGVLSEGIGKISEFEFGSVVEEDESSGFDKEVILKNSESELESVIKGAERSGIVKEVVLNEGIRKNDELDFGSVMKEVEMVKDRYFERESGAEAGFSGIELEEGLKEGEIDEFEEKIMTMERSDEVETDDLDIVKEVKEKRLEKNGEFDLEVVKEDPQLGKAMGFEEAEEKDDEFDLEVVKGERELGKDESNEVKRGLEEVRFVEYECDGENRVGVEERREVEKDRLFNEDDDWEGVERSELEKRFGAVAKFVVSGNCDILSKVGNDVKMELYGLHKVAMEGPCSEPQPSMLKLSARAKWLESCYV